MLLFLLFLILSPLCAFLVVAIPFQLFKFFQKPKLDRNWFGLYSQLPHCTIDPHQNVYIRNIRHAHYNPNYEFECRVHYLNKKYNINDLQKMWLFVNPYGLFQSHVILSFQFGHEHIVKNYLTISYEIRKCDPQDFKISNIIFKNFEGHFIMAGEEDTIFVRTNVRHNYEETLMYMFPLNVKKEAAQKIFLDMLNEVNDYSKHPFFYRLYGRNCVTQIFKHFKKYNLVSYSTNYPLVSLLKFLYNSTLIEGNENISFAQFKKKYYITGKTKGLDANENFSFELRNRV